jgi:C-terminal processing protease CtpA/Prc
MLAGVGPLLGEGVCGYFIRNEEKVPIIYKSGGSWQGKNLRTSVSGKPHILETPVKKIMVLTGSRTCSSGEIVALAFKGLPNVQLIGEATAGLTTANSTYQLSNNAMLVLSVCREADRTGRLCQGSIRPDHWVDHSEKDGFDAIKQTAYALLR